MSIEPELVQETDDYEPLALLNKSEIDTQIATAKRYPRSVKQFVQDATEMACLSEEVAGECMYALKRGNKVIEGPSARFAEIVLSAWGNARGGARIVDESDRFVTAQGAFLDLQRNVAITYETRRRITTSTGTRYGDDMIGVTSNAACSIAIRNAVLKGIPKAFWKSVYDAARKTAIGDAASLTQTRQKMIEHFGRMGVEESRVLSFLERQGVEDITLDDVALLRGIATSIKDGDATVEQTFNQPASGSRAKKSDLSKPKPKEQKPETQEETAPESSETDVVISRNLIQEELAEAQTVEQINAVYDKYKPELTGGDANWLFEAAENRHKEVTAKGKPQGGKGKGSKGKDELFEKGHASPA